jgi:hypothetical protein
MFHNNAENTLPPYEACAKTSYTQENIEEFKEQLENIETELLNIKSNDIRKPQLRRQAADLEEIIINFENTKPKPEIVQSLDENIKYLSEYVELEKYNILDNTIHEQISSGKVFKDDIEFPYRAAWSTRQITKTDIDIFITFLTKKFPRHSYAIEKHVTEAKVKLEEYLLKNPQGSNTYSNLLSCMRTIISQENEKALKRRAELKPFIAETQLEFNIKLSTFMETIIDEKTQMENKIIELENSITKLVKIVYEGRGEDPSKFQDIL